ncbi:c-type cytochrome [Pedobacter nyackensis]|uniref:c-type cytochrome n=1 Tax=Pedobacter nyackensis TaxID=475255 RepID=UPI0029314613|nr:c-type cytochrome [Pedobacter nyackensis]
MRYLLLQKKSKIFIYILIISLYSTSCNSSNTDKEVTISEKTDSIADYIKPIEGKNDTISLEAIEKGKVLISYSDCYTCHKEDKRSFGPAFRDIAKRYPANKVFIQMLAQKVIVGGSRGWGYAVMLPHPKLSAKDAELMVSYILSLKE